MAPLSGFKSFAIAFNTVDFPDPFGPIIEIISPFLKEEQKSLTTFLFS